MSKVRVSIIGMLIVVILVGVVLFSFRGCRRGVGIFTGGNVYSEGYRDGYIQGVSEKREGFGGVTYIGEVKLSFHGYGSVTDITKAGQPTMGGWAANFYEENIKHQCEAVRGDQLVRVYYKEIDVRFTGSTDYEVTKVILLPEDGMQSLVTEGE